MDSFRSKWASCQCSHTHFYRWYGSLIFKELNGLRFTGFSASVYCCRESKILLCSGTLLHVFFFLNNMFLLVIDCTVLQSVWYSFLYRVTSQAATSNTSQASTSHRTQDRNSASLSCSSRNRHKTSTPSPTPVLSGGSKKVSTDLFISSVCL
jgi:hypothetical protein